MLIIKIFGSHDFEIREPSIGALPPLYHQTWASELGRERLARELGEAKDLSAADPRFVAL
jgi:hypothetical protein